MFVTFASMLIISIKNSYFEILFIKDYYLLLGTI